MFKFKQLFEFKILLSMPKPKFIFMLFIGLFTFCQASAQKINPAEARQAQQLIQDCFDNIWSACDTSAISTFHTKNYLLLENGIVWTNDSVRQFQIKEKKETLKGKYVRKNKLEFIKSEKRGKSIWLAYHNYATWIKGEEVVGKAHWLESAIVIRSGKAWKIELLHSTPVRDH